MDVKLVKLVTGEVVLGDYDEVTQQLCEVVNIQTVPSGNNQFQLALIPYGYPYEPTFVAKIEEKHFLYVYSKCPDELKNKYLEIKSNIKIAPASSLNSMVGGAGSDSGIIV
ncbi:hypothetical protein RsTz2092_08030 [Deferribacterales bacterium RsTz2092]|nr:hypothetical protein AGMMS49941_08650 [Deferribacterales bacterium]